MLALRDGINLGGMAMKWYSTFPKAPALLEPHHLIVHAITRTLVGVESYTRDADSVLFYTFSRLGKFATSVREYDYVYERV